MYKKADSMNLNKVTIENLNRNKALDCACGCMIIIMILHHIFIRSHLNNTIEYYYYSNLTTFFMPWFFYKSGMFFKPLNYNRSKNKIKKYINRLLIPWLAFSIIGVCVQFIVLILFEESSFKSFFYSIVTCFIYKQAPLANIVLWYLITLFIVKSVYSIYGKYLIKNQYIIFVLILSIVCSMHLITLPQIINNTLLGIFFYAIGYRVKNVENKAVIVPILLISIFIFVFVPSNISFVTGRINNGYLLVWMIYSVCMILTVNYLFSLWHNKIFETIGKNSLSYYVVHFPILFFISKWNECCDFFSNMEILLIMIFVSIILLPILSKMLKHSPYNKLLGI